jgi:hypothetical protein
MKRLIPILFLVLPLAAFAQSPMTPKARETGLLKSFGLNDSQIAQVFDIQDKTRTTISQDVAQLRLLHAQMEKALLPASPNMQEVNGYITQMAQAREDLMKTFVGARVQLRQIIGEDNFPIYARFIRNRFSHRSMFFEKHRMHRQRPGGMMDGGALMRLGDDAPAGLSNEQTD